MGISSTLIQRDLWQPQLSEIGVCEHFDSQAWEAVERYLTSGPFKLRLTRMTEFLKALDWLALSEIRPSVLAQMSPGDQKRLKTAIGLYLQSKANRRAESKTKREDYRQRVFTYFRDHVSPSDKALLESLRDYELDLTGQDDNWRHYFWMTSFKQIDAFIHASLAERMSTVEQFRRDVQTRVHNEALIQAGLYSDYYWGSEYGAEPVMVDEESPIGNPHRRPSVKTPPHPLAESYRLLKLTPYASFEEVKRQFRLLTLTHHPDVPGGSVSKMQALVSAYEDIKRYLCVEAS